ncbi:ORMDL family [Plasmodiophora brassicae]|uniref:Uncharacterized protein n=1 Tax=Plasmodiophora brassicae TaxID=37360 RepID=A0A0G4IRU3_PLABS|nr:hypothetical protein PBRA_006207 [Plasmodiophora brassicae]SPQ96088.1 unnamed protein product [Plasmodiophora brassicae]
MGDVTADEFDNRNVAFLNGKGFWVFYIATILVFRYLLFAIPILHWRHCAWTVVHQIHTAVTFLLFHWNKGSPVAEDQGVYDEETFWEQIDRGTQYTTNRKFLTILPVIVFLLASYESGWNVDLVVANTISLAIILIAKSPYMHRVRILGINKD